MATPQVTCLRILVVEDDEPIAAALVSNLKRAGHAVDHVGDGVSADEALQGDRFDLALLDLGLPRMDGFDVLTRMRHRGNHTPVLILSALDAVNDRIRGLDAGADDYIHKPFDMHELEARIRAVARRGLARSGDEIRGGRLCLKPRERSVSVDDQPIELAAREYGLLECLLLNRGRVMSKAQIQDRLCDWSEELSETAIELYVHRLRRKIDASVLTIRTVRGFGYLLQIPDESN
jgi:two-component system OmpR family response regulator